MSAARLSGDLDPCFDGDLPARGVLEYFLDKAFEGARRHPPLSVALFRLEGLDDLEGDGSPETAGHLVGMASEVLSQLTRRMNVFGHLEGGIFLSLLPGEDLKGANAYARRIVGGVATYPTADGLPIAFNAGIAAYDPAMETSAALLDAAGRALDAASRLRGSRAVVCPGPGEPPAGPGLLLLGPEGDVTEAPAPD
ncbi:MAG: GGDEF domain-containing protein [Gemmatimonadota bacterium]